MIDKDLFKLLGKNKKYIFLAVGLMFIGLIANLSFTFSICYVVEIIIDSLDSINYLYAAIIACISLIVRYIVTRVLSNVKDCLGKNVKKELRLKVFDKIISLGDKSPNEISLAGLTQVSMEGIEQLDLYYSEYLPQFFYAMIAPFVLFGLTVGLDWRPSVALICLVPMIPISIVMVSKYAKKVFNKYWDKYTSMGDAFLDSTMGLKELKIFRADSKRNEVMNEKAEEFRHITMKVLVMQLASSTIMDTVAYGGAGLGIILVVLGAINNWNSPIWGMSTVIPVSLFIVLISVDFFLPMRRLGSAFHVGMNGASAGRKILALFKLDDPIWGSERIEAKTIELKDVTFSYNCNTNVLNNVNLKFDCGINAIVGESGSGKSTIVSLIMGLNRANSGSVLIGGKNIESLSRLSYYNELGVISYNTYIFNESIRNNFKLSKNNVTDSEIYDALKHVNLYDFVIENGGLDKIIYEDSENISGGQRQRLALAINLVSNKSIYIFDEATSNIDIESEAIIMNTIHSLSKDKIVIVISHRLENVVNADKIYYLENKEVKECGNHNTLILNNNGYKRLYEMQKALENGYMEVATYAE